MTSDLFSPYKLTWYSFYLGHSKNLTLFKQYIILYNFILFLFVEKGKKYLQLTNIQICLTNEALFQTNFPVYYFNVFFHYH